MQYNNGRQDHCRWECKYHIVWIPKYRKRILYGKLRQGVGRILRKLCEEKKIGLVEGHAMGDHVHVCLSIPPKYSVANTVGYLKGKSAIRVHREYLHARRKDFQGYHFWARGYYVSTVGLDEKIVRDYIRKQEDHDRQVDQLTIPL